MENFENCTVAMLGGPCSQHGTGNTSRLDQLQSTIVINKPFLKYIYVPEVTYNCSVYANANRLHSAWALFQLVRDYKEHVASDNTP